MSSKNLSCKNAKPAKRFSGFRILKMRRLYVTTLINFPSAFAASTLVLLFHGFLLPIYARHTVIDEERDDVKFQQPSAGNA
jgi:hypothetical protein